MVAGRRREIAIRLATGARDGDLMRWVLGEGLQMIGFGLAAGLLLAFLLLKLTVVVSDKLIQISPTDPVTYLACTLLLLGVALLGCLIPARRALRVDPARTLREE
jgi:ABC-type antimicrobial peptide transport system permease subunit